MVSFDDQDDTDDRDDRSLNEAIQVFHVADKNELGEPMNKIGDDQVK